MKLEASFDNAAVTNSVGPTHLDLVGVRAPALASGTAALRIETTEDDASVDDASATWDTVYDSDGLEVEIPVSDTEAQRVGLDPGPLMMLGRFRFRAVDSSGSDVTQTTGTVVAYVRPFGA